MTNPIGYQLPDPFVSTRDTRILNEILGNIQRILDGGVEGGNIRQGGVGSREIANGAVADSALSDEQPTKPGSISLTTGLNNATSIAYIDVTWAQPAGAETATWEVRWRRQGATGVDAVYRYRMVGTQSFRIENVYSNVTYEVGVSAYSRTGTSSGYAAADTTVVTQSGGQPPPEVNLVVDKLLAGTLSAQVLLSGNIRTGDSGARVQVDSTGVKLYNTSGQVITTLSTTTGRMDLGGIASIKTWDIRAGTWAITSNNAHASTQLSGTASYATINADRADGVFKMGLYLSPTRACAGLLFRFSPTTNSGYEIRLHRDASTNAAQVIKWTNGAFTFLNNNVKHGLSVLLGGYYEITVVTKGDKIRVFVWDTLIYDGEDSTYSTNTYMGLTQTYIATTHDDGQSRFWWIASGSVADNFNRVNGALGSTTSAARVSIDGTGLRMLNPLTEDVIRFYNSSGEAIFRGLVDGGIVLGGTIVGATLIGGKLKTGQVGERVEIGTGFVGGGLLNIWSPDAAQTLPGILHSYVETGYGAARIATVMFSGKAGANSREGQVRAMSNYFNGTGDSVAELAAYTGGTFNGGVFMVHGAAAHMLNEARNAYRTISASAFVVNSTPKLKRDVVKTAKTFRDKRLGLYDFYYDKETRKQTAFNTEDAPPELLIDMSLPGTPGLSGFSTAELIAHVYGHLLELDTEVEILKTKLRPS